MDNINIKCTNKTPLYTGLLNGMRGQIYGFDVLKFFMAMMIVAIHTKAFDDIELIHNLTAPFLSSAVPTFFILSSYFLFRKMEFKGYSWNTYNTFLKRLLILYLFWFVATLPVTLYQKWYYFDCNIGDFIIRLIVDFLFASTFAGSWFLSSLLVGALVVFILRKYLRVSSFILVSLAALTYLYIHEYRILPELFQKPLVFIQNNIRDEVQLTPIVGFIWCSVGCVIAKNQLLERLSDNMNVVGTFSAFIVLYLLRVFLPIELRYLSIPFLVFSIILLSFQINFKHSELFLKLRNLSILIYLIHFVLLSIHLLLPTNRHYIVYYLIVLIGALIISEIILKLEKYHCFYFLKYSH